MPHKDKEKRKEQNRLHYIANKEKINEKCRLYHIANKDKIKEYHKAYRQTSAGKKTRAMADWRSSGVKDVNDELYDKYINTHCCDVCNKEFKNSTDRCLDHDHTTGEFRQILCRACNIHDNWMNKLK